VPFLIFGASSLVAGLAFFTLPETLGAPLPEGLSDMVAIQSVFSTSAFDRGGSQLLKALFRTHAAGAGGSGGGGANKYAAGGEHGKAAAHA